jgi:V/A-type H+-transporting ATPase subunit C
MSLLKCKDSNLNRELVIRHLIDGGHISQNELMDMFESKNTGEFVDRIDEHLDLGELLETYRKTHSLIDFEVALDKFTSLSYVQKLKSISLSIGFIFHFIIIAEFEWDNVKRIAYGKRYGIPMERINSMLLFE